MKFQLKIIQDMPGPVKHFCLSQRSSCLNNVQIHSYMTWTPNPGKHVLMAQKWTRIQAADQLMVLSAYILVHSSSWPASWSSGRVQDSGLGSRSSPGFNTLLLRLLVVHLSKALHAALLLSTQEEMGTFEGRFVSRGAKLCVSGCTLSRELRWLSRRICTVKGPMTKEGTCQSLQSRALSLDVDSKQWLYL